MYASKNKTANRSSTSAFRPGEEERAMVVDKWPCHLRTTPVFSVAAWLPVRCDDNSRSFCDTKNTLHSHGNAVLES